VFFEVPDVVRILEGKAFWDIYYEHCGYFSPGSLARLFRRCGFHVTSIDRVYNEQYITLEAEKTRPCPAKIHHIEETVEELHRLVDSFSQDLAESLKGWSIELEQAAAKGMKLAVWGSGSKCVGFLSTLHIGESIECVVDVNPNRQGLFIPGSGHEIHSPRALKAIQPDVVIVMNRVYEQEIKSELQGMGLNPKVLAL
jgi:hypothetical protein